MSFLSRAHTTACYSESLLIPRWNGHPQSWSLRPEGPFEHPTAQVFSAQSSSFVMQVRRSRQVARFSGAACRNSRAPTRSI